MNEIAECNICRERLEVENTDEIKTHYQSEHNISPVQECQRCGEEKLLVERAWNRYGWKRVVVRVYCDECVEDPLEEMLYRQITDAEGMKDIHESRRGRPKALSKDEVRLVREKYETGNYTIPELVEDFDVSETVIFKAKEGEYQEPRFSANIIDKGGDE